MRAGKKRLLFFPHKTTNKGGEVVPKAKNAKADEALALYRQGLQLIEIARRLDVPPGTVRRWKCTYKWDGEKANARKRKKRTLEKEAASLETTTRPGPLGTTMR